MIGLIYIIVGLVYLTITILLVKVAARAAKRRGLAGWKWGLPALLVMYLLVFWDWIPTVAMYKYYCSKDAGFTVYKTLEEWKNEFPGVIDSLLPANGVTSIIGSNRERLELNQRFAWDIVRQRLRFGIIKIDNSIIDKASKVVMARYVDFDTDIRGVSLSPRNIRDYKFWIRKWSCEADDAMLARKQFYQFENSVGDPQGETK